MKRLRNIKGIFALILTVFLLGACSMGEPMGQPEVDPPQVNYVDEEEDLGNVTNDESDVDTEVELVWRELYLFDKNGYVVPQTIQVPKDIGVAKQSLQYLVKDGPITELLPNGFQAVLPPNTEILGLNIENKIATVDFSDEFLTYLPEEESKILQAITFTLTQFNEIDQVKIMINGETQDVMPVNGTPIGNGLSRADGINLELGNVYDVVNTKSITLYFLAHKDDEYYYVPVTRRVDRNVENIAAIIDELIKGPLHSSPLLTAFGNEVTLLTEPKFENGLLTLDFNEALLGYGEESTISDTVLQSLVLSLTEQVGVEKISIMVNGNTDIMMSSGEVIAEPVSRPEEVNKAKY
jgi:germination protein M